MKVTIINLFLGAIFGVIGKIVYDKIQKNSESKRITKLLIIEMKSNLLNIHNLLKNIETIEISQIREHLQPFTLEEIANKIEDSCKKEHLNKCTEKLPYLGREKMESVFSFYNAFSEEANFLRELPRFGGCISTHTNENTINRLISICESRLEEFEKA